MASSVNSILGIGAGALYAHQNSIQTTGNNIANVDTEGYSRQGVRYETNPSLNAYPGQIGQGVRATEVYRMFNRFVEKAYIDKSADFSRWSEQHNLLKNIDALVYESDTIPGVASTLGQFFTGWQTLSNNGTLLSSREALLSDAESLATFVREQYSTLTYMQQQMDGLIQMDIERANKLIQEIAQLNNQINVYSIPGQNNPNSLLDQRDLKVRQLAEIVDIDVIDRGEGHYTVSTKSGLTLVDEGVGYSFEFHGPEVQKYLTSGSAYTGNVVFTGNDENEYTLDIVTGGTVNSGATFRLSLDGGKTWLCNDNAWRTDAQIAGLSPADLAEKGVTTFEVNDDSKPIYVKELEISFENSGALSSGDRFTIVPKSAIYWNSPTTGLLNVTPQTLPDGTQNPRRLTGGTMTAYFEFRDHLIGEYRDRLDTFTRSLAWEVNHIHSQGVGLEKLTTVLGDYQVKNDKAALTSPYSGLTFGDKLQAGTFTIALYDADDNPVLDANGQHQLVKVNFDPTSTTQVGIPPNQVDAGSLQGLKLAIDNAVSTVNADRTAAGLTTVSFQTNITDGRLDLSSSGGTSFGFVNDTTGVMAGLGINTFFKGDGAGDFSVRADIVKNLNLINAAAINGGGEGNSGDTLTALEMAQLGSKKISIRNPTTGKVTEQTLLGYYSAYVTKVGADTQTAKYNTALYGSMAQDLRNQQDSNSGVNLDEEMTNLVKFQNSYKAAAKLITTADEMLQTILGLKQ